MTTNETTALKTAAERQADLLIEMDEAGVMLPEDPLVSIWAMIGMALTAVRHPEKAPLAPAVMTAHLEGNHVMFSKVLAKHNARKREAGL